MINCQRPRSDSDDGTRRHRPSSPSTWASVPTSFQKAPLLLRALFHSAHQERTAITLYWKTGPNWRTHVGHSLFPFPHSWIHHCHPTAVTSSMPSHLNGLSHGRSSPCHSTATSHVKQGLDADSYVETKNTVADGIIDRLNRVFPGLKDGIVFRQNIHL